MSVPHATPAPGLGGTPANHATVIGTGGNTVTSAGPGTAGQVLTSNGAAADPTFQAAGGAGYTQIATSTATGAANIDFTGIPQTYSDLFLVGIGISSSAIITSWGLNLFISTDNGATFSSTSIGLCSAVLISDTCNFAATIYGYRLGAGAIYSNFITDPAASPVIGTNGNSQNSFVATGGINALRAAISTGGGVIDANTSLTLYGR